MATSQGQFQLFPTTQPQNRPNNPPKKHRRRSTKSPTVSPVLENAKSSEQTEALILKIIEDTNSGIPSQNNHQPADNSPLMRSGSSHETGTSGTSNSRPIWPSRSASLPSRSPDTQYSASPSSQSNGVSFSPAVAPSNFTPPPPPPGVHFKGDRKNDIDTNVAVRAHSPSPTSKIPESKKSIDMVRSTRSLSLNPAGPPVPMKSIFPRYDPNVPLNQQRYYPNGGRPQNVPHRAVSRTDYMPGNAFSESAIHRPQSRKGPEVASLETLEQLWNTTSGEDFNNDVDIYHLRMKRIDSLTYTFGSDSLPFYTLNTNPMNDIELHKTHPSKENTKSPIVTLNLGNFEADNGSPVRISLFPKLAEIQAREQCAELARRDQLAPSQAMEAENDAVRRAEAQETCTLEWHPGKTNYELHYQALKPGSSNSSSTLREANELSGLLHASVSSSSSRQATSYQPTILVTIPDQTTTGTYSPQLNNNEPPLLALDLDSATLSIFAGSLLPKIPSLYSIDTLVAAIMTVALSNEPARAAMTNMDIYEPKAEDFPDPYRSGPNTPRPSGSSFARYTGNLVTTLAEREEAEQEAALMRQIRSQSSTERIKFSWPWKKPRLEAEEIDLEANITTKTKRKEDNDNTNTNTNNNKDKDETKKSPVVSSLDLGKYGDFKGENGSHAREKLPKPTRAALRFLFWIFSLIVWVLSKSVKFLAWLLVGATRCFSSEKR